MTLFLIISLYILSILLSRWFTIKTFKKGIFKIADNFPKMNGITNYVGLWFIPIINIIILFIAIFLLFKNKYGENHIFIKIYKWWSGENIIEFFKKF